MDRERKGFKDLKEIFIIKFSEGKLKTQSKGIGSMEIIYESGQGFSGNIKEGK